MKKLILAISIFTACSANAQQDKEMQFFDVFIQPTFSLGLAGEYNIGEGASQIDDGSFGLLGFGGQAGIKLGAVFVGFSYLTGDTLGSSKQSVSASNRETYPEPGEGKLTSIGPVIGLKFDKFFLWATSTSDSLEQDLTSPERYKHTYDGTGYRVALEIDISRNFHAGFFYHNRNFDKYTSTLSTNTVDNADLPQELDTAVYGLTFSYFFPVSRMSEISNLFKN